jgi:hypothetical protein
MRFRTASLSPRGSRVLALGLRVVGSFAGLAILVRLTSVGASAFTSTFVGPSDDFVMLPYGDLPRSFDVAWQLAQLFGDVPPVCIAFALAGIFAAGARRAPIPKESLSRLVLVACGFYALEGALTVAVQLPALGQTIRALGFSSPGVGLASVSAVLLGVLSLLVPFVYAAGVYVLHLHFARLLTFEEEVA